MKIAFTGHRPDKLGGYKDDNPIKKLVVDKIVELLKKYQPEEVIVGMAVGVDQWAAEACLKLGIPFVAAIPFAGQESRWPKASQDRYRFLLSKAKETVTVCSGGYAAWKMQTRNEWMVDDADLVIAVWDGSSGGTANCVSYANKTETPIDRINPKELYG